jgi:hypothetical protein
MFYSNNFINFELQFGQLFLHQIFPYHTKLDCLTILMERKNWVKIQIKN